MKSQLLTYLLIFAILIVVLIAWVSTWLRLKALRKTMSVKTAHSDMNHSEDLFQAVFEHAPCSIVINDYHDGMYLTGNKTFLDARGLSEEELKKMNIRDIGLLPEDERLEILDNLKKSGSVKNRETTIFRKDGSSRTVNFSSAMIDVKGRKQILSIAVDITDQKLAEESLKKSEERFRALFFNAPIPLAYSTIGGKVITVNDRLTRTLGYTSDDVPDLDHWWKLAYPDPDYRQKVVATWRSEVKKAIADNSPIGPGEFLISCKDGRVLNMIVVANVIGDTLLTSFFDITRRREAEEERKKLQEKLHQARKMEAIGTLAGGVAHDFNNMLGAIMGYAELTIDQMDPADRSRKNLDRILEAAQRSANLTRQLLAFARKQTIEPVVFDLNRSVESLLKILRRLIGENIELYWSPGKGTCKVSMDPTQLDQVLINLCVNAKDAITETGRINIETGMVSFDETYCESRTDCTPGTYVLLAVSDNGCGMDKNTADHVFEPFFTTKGPGRGTGMGMATIYGIIRQNGGFIDVYSEPGKGSTFRIYLPLDASEEETETPDLIEAPPQGRQEAILIVEDDPTLLEMSSIMLENLGYSVIRAGLPGEAVSLFRENRNRTDLVITDVVMPEMNGRELADRLESIRPGMKILYMSGYTANVIANQGVLDESTNFIQKPFSMQELAIKVRRALEG